MTLLRRSSVLVLVLVASAISAFPQPREVLPVFRLRQITGQAGVIFAGTVVALEYEKPRAVGEVGAMRITFQVERGLRGVRGGSRLTIREWEGLWSSGERYRVGERVVLFLYPNSKLGLTSPVGGRQGRFAMTRSGEVVLVGEQAALLSNQPLMPRAKDRVTLPEFTQAVRRAAAREK
jgi:hypothetical protein